MQFLARQGMVEIQLDRIFGNRDHFGIERVPIGVRHLQFHAGGQGDVGREFRARDVAHLFRIVFTVGFSSRYADLFLIPDLHVVEFFFQAGNDVFVPLQEFNRFFVFRIIQHLTVDSQGIEQTDDHVISHCLGLALGTHVVLLLWVRLHKNGLPRAGQIVFVSRLYQKPALKHLPRGPNSRQMRTKGTCAFKPP